jgi:hypothetical protein
MPIGAQIGALRCIVPVQSMGDRPPVSEPFAYWPPLPVRTSSTVFKGAPMARVVLGAAAPRRWAGTEQPGSFGVAGPPTSALVR